MAPIESQKITSNKKAPEFRLLDTVSDRQISRDEIVGEYATVVMFICNHCPYVKHLLDGIVQISHDYMDRGIGIVAISTNNVDEFPTDGPQYMKELAQKNNFNFPYLYDETQEIAKAYSATCTPDLYIFNKKLELAYHGQFDNSRPENGLNVTGESFRIVLDALIEGKKIPQPQIPSIGCSIKWK